jgi:hypothetical protein
MKLNEFGVGLEFWCAGKRWRCTDVGSRVVVAICLEPHEIVRLTAGAGTSSGALERGVTNDRNWFNGPPFAIEESVFDEHDLPACEEVRSDSG